MKESLRAQVEAWIADDPDPETRDELVRVLAAADGGDPDAAEDLADRFAGILQFGTAGLRGELGAGPNRMNRALVIRAAAGLTAYLMAEGGREPTVVIGYDARRCSDVFARDSAAVVVAAGGRAAVLPRPLPTPVLAFAVRHLGADAGVMVTASHNPPQDNGYKVYLGDGCQIAPPADARIADRIAAVRSVADVPRADDGWETLGDEVVEDYLDAVCRVVAPGGPRELSVVHTSLHGVGGDTVRRAFVRAGFIAPQPVPSQARPDPDFPTVSFPNPEEPGALDAAIALARQVGPDLVIASDPDADRCAVAVPVPVPAGASGGAGGGGGGAGGGGAGGDWRMLRGDEVGALLGAHVVARGLGDGAVLATSIVSSRLLAAIAATAGVAHVETLTGFKWIARVPGLVYGYEEALGYCVAPAVVRDKDGVSSALLLAELAASLKAQGRTLLDALDDLAIEHGVYATDSFSVRVEDGSRAQPLVERQRLVQRLRSRAPRELARVSVARVDDLRRGEGGLPPTDGIRIWLADRSRIVVRPSGTEPKIKVYLEVIEPVGGPGDLTRARHTAALRLAAMRSGLSALTAV